MKKFGDLCDQFRRLYGRVVLKYRWWWVNFSPNHQWQNRSAMREVGLSSFRDYMVFPSPMSLNYGLKYWKRTKRRERSISALKGIVVFLATYVAGYFLSFNFLSFLIVFALYPVLYFLDRLFDPGYMLLKWENRGPEWYKHQRSIFQRISEENGDILRDIAEGIDLRFVPFPHLVVGKKNDADNLNSLCSIYKAKDKDKDKVGDCQKVRERIKQALRQDLRREFGNRSEGCFQICLPDSLKIIEQMDDRLMDCFDALCEFNCYMPLGHTFGQPHPWSRNILVPSDVWEQDIEKWFNPRDLLLVFGDSCPVKVKVDVGQPQERLIVMDSSVLKSLEEIGCIEYVKPGLVRRERMACGEGVFVKHRWKSQNALFVLNTKPDSAVHLPLGQARWTRGGSLLAWYSRNERRVEIEGDYLSILRELLENPDPKQFNYQIHPGDLTTQRIFCTGPQFDSWRPFSEGLAVVRSDSKYDYIHGGKYGYINSQGKTVIKKRFDEAGDFSCGIAYVNIGGKSGYIDRSGEFITDRKLDSVGRFSEDRAVVTKGGKWGYIDRSGTTIINLQFDYADPFSEGLARVSINGKYGYIDKNGEIAIPLKFDSAGKFSQEKASVQINGRSGIINRSGEFVADSR